MKKLLFLLLAIPAFGQSYNRIDGTLQNSLGQALSGATVYVCTQPCNSATIPPSPLATIYSDTIGTPTTSTGQVTTDGNGNFFYYTNLTTQTEVFVYRGLVVKVLPDQTAPGAGGSTSCGTAGAIIYRSLIGTFSVCDPSATLDGNGTLQVAKIGVGGAPVFKFQVQTATAGDAVAKFKNTDPTGFGVKFIPGNDNNYGIAVGNQAESANNFTVDGNGNVNANGTIAAPTGTYTSVNTTGPGWTKTVQCQTPPSNPPAGSITFYCNSGTGLFATLNSSGGSANPGGATWGTVTSGTNSNAGTFAASGNSWDFTGTTIFKMRVGAGLTSSANGDIGYDTTNKNWHVFQNGVDSFLLSAQASGTFVANDCTKIASINPLTFADSGGACGASGSASPIMFGCPAFTNTVTQFCGGGNISTAEPVSQVPVPRSGTVSNLQCRVGGTGLSSAQTLTFTVRKGAAAITAITSADTTVTCTMNSTNTAGCSDGTHNFTVAAGDVLDIKTVPANSPTNVAFNCSVQLL